MRRLARQWKWLIPALGVLGAVLFLRKSPADRIREDLESLAGCLRFEKGAPTPDWAAALGSTTEKRVADPVTINIEAVGEAAYARAQLVNALVDFSSKLDGLAVSLHDVGIQIDDNAERATAKGEVYLELFKRNAERRGEPRKFSATLQRGAQGWLLVHFQLSAPRIDQPEARP